MSLAQVFTSFSSSSYSASYSSSTTVSAERGRGGDLVDDGAVSDVYVASESYRFEASYSVYTEKSNYSSGTSEESESESRTVAANNILGFIGNRLQLDKAEGATEEELSSRLSAGMEGFIKGYQEAYEQLSELTFLNEDVENAIEKTFSGVLDGINDLADELGIESPVTNEIEEAQQSRRSEFDSSQVSKTTTPEIESEKDDPVQSQSSSSAPSLGQQSQTGSISSDINNAGVINEQAENLRSLIQASSYNYQAAESRSFNFSLTTQDGDEITIRAAYDTVALLNGESVNYGDSSSSSVSGEFRASSGFYLDVRGELDEEEFQAIEDLLGQVKQVSDLFFSGDLEKAFEYATEVGFDTNEIAEFSLRLRYQTVVKAEETYQQISPAETNPNSFDVKDQRLLLVAQFVQALEDLRLNAKDLGISGFSAVDAINSLPENEGADKNLPTGIVGNLLSSLEQLQNQSETEA